MSSQEPKPPEIGLSAKARRTGEQPISFLMAAVVANPKLINLAAGLVDPLTLPIEASQTITQKILADPASPGGAAIRHDPGPGRPAESRRQTS